MSWPSSLDFNRLLTPIPGDNPCGADLRWEPVYQEIKDARTQRNDMLGQDDETAVNWNSIVTLATDALAERSKDLMIACWLTEALVHSQGFSGLRDGLQLVGDLLGTFWDQLYPAVEDGDLEPRVAPLVWLTDADRGARLPNSLRELPLVPGEAETYSWSFWKSRYPQAKGENEDETVFARRKAEAEDRAKRFEDAVVKASRDHVEQLHRAIQASATELSRLDKLLDEKFSRLAPGTTGLRQSLSECEVLVRRMVRDKGGVTEGETAAADGESAQNGQGQPTHGSSSHGPIGSREEAFRRLAEIAAYLRQSEPQSPVSYLIERAVTWGRMPFEQLLSELIRDAGVRGQVGELLGIKSSNEGG